MALPRNALFADLADSGDRKEGCAFPDTTPTSTFPQGGIAGDYNNYQYNFGAVRMFPAGTISSGALVWSVQYGTANATHPLGNVGGGSYFGSPLDSFITAGGPDNPDASSFLKDIFYSPPPSSPNTTTNFATACDMTVSGPSSMNISPAFAGGGGFPGFLTGCVGVVSGSNFTFCFSRLLPQAVYNVNSQFNVYPNTGSTTIDFYWSTPQGDNHFLSIDGGGNPTPSLPFSVNISQPWAFIKAVVTNVTANVTGVSAGNGVLYQYNMTFDPCVWQHPLGHTVTHPAATSFFINAQGFSSLTFQWQKDSGGGFSNLSNAGVYSGVATSTLSISNSTGLNGVRYRCVVTDSAGVMNSNAAILTVI